MSFKAKINAATPLICLIIYFIMGFCYDKWHPGWVVFFAIPIVPILTSINSFRGLYPVLTVVAYLVIGFVWRAWHPGWIVFLTIPVVDIFLPRKKVEKVEIIED